MFIKNCFWHLLLLLPYVRPALLHLYAIENSEGVSWDNQNGGWVGGTRGCSNTVGPEGVHIRKPHYTP